MNIFGSAKVKELLHFRDLISFIADFVCSSKKCVNPRAFFVVGDGTS